jgi:hypothetical protein
LSHQAYILWRRWRRQIYYNRLSIRRRRRRKTDTTEEEEGISCDSQSQGIPLVKIISSVYF